MTAWPQFTGPSLVVELRDKRAKAEANLVMGLESRGKDARIGRLYQCFLPWHHRSVRESSSLSLSEQPNETWKWQRPGLPYHGRIQGMERLLLDFLPCSAASPRLLNGSCDPWICLLRSISPVTRRAQHIYNILSLCLNYVSASPSVFKNCTLPSFVLLHNHFFICRS